MSELSCSSHSQLPPCYLQSRTEPANHDTVRNSRHYADINRYATVQELKPGIMVQFMVGGRFLF